MSEEDLEKFIKKIEHLNDLLNSLEKIPGRKKKLANCSSHDEVIKLAHSWGFDIGRRWGDPN
tara:strand:+ start:11879 stop:12064 length:186 start_codon:yes stop_codon:yes gene_type:complete